MPKLLNIARTSQYTRETSQRIPKTKQRPQKNLQYSTPTHPKMPAKR